MAPHIDYGSRDFDTVKAALITYLQTQFGDSYRDFSESSLGLMLLELFAYVADGLNYYIDQTANELYIPTARDRDSLLLLGRLVGYQLRTPRGASVNCEAVLDQVYAQDIVVPAGTVVNSAGGVPFVTLDDQTIPAGQVEGDILFSQGQVRTDTFTGTGDSYQQCALQSSAVIFGSISVTVDGVPWDSVDSLIYSGATDTDYMPMYDDENKGYVNFGDGVSGSIPVLGSVIEVTYRTGGGVQGNIAVGEINLTVAGQKVGILPIETVNVALENTERGSGGEEQETIAHAKMWIPKWTAANGRAVTINDFDALANAFSDPVAGAPAFAKAKLHQRVAESNLVDIALWSRDSEGHIAPPSAALKAAVLVYFMNDGVGAVRIVCTDVDVLDGEIAYTDVYLTVMAESAFAAGDIIAACALKLDGVFDTLTPGDAIRLSKIYQEIMDVPGVAHVLIDLIVVTDRVFDTIGVGAPPQTNFTGNLTVPPAGEIEAQTVTITDGTQVAYDDGDGNLIGDVDSGGTNTVDYITGAVDVTFATAPALGLDVIGSNGPIVDYARSSDVVETGDGAQTRFTGVLTYPPITPRDGAVKGITFAAGSQVCSDPLGNGALVGNLDGGGENVIDYETGKYDLTWGAAPGAGVEMVASYYQRLRTASEDVPIDEGMIASPNAYHITVVRPTT